MAAVIEPTLRFHESGIIGAGPGLWYGTNAPDGDAGDFARAPVGSRYYRRLSAGGGIWYEKVSTKNLDGDWRPTTGVIVQTVTFSQFTDGTGAAGTLVLTDQIPVGATVKRSFLLALTGFTGDTSCTLTVGDGTDPDRYNTGTPSIFTTAAGETDLGAVSGTAYHAAAASVTLTATSDSDWTAVAAGSMTVVIVLG
jgi:hypothetical protein